MTIGHEDFIYTQTWTHLEVEELRLGNDTNGSFPEEL